MRFVTFLQKNQACLGAVIQDRYVIDLHAGFDAMGSQQEKPDVPALPSTLRALLEQGKDVLNTAGSVVDFAEKQIENASLPQWIMPLEAVTLTAPIPNPSKVVAIGQNYRDHCLEQNAPIPERPIIFTKFPTSVIGPQQGITWDPALTTQVDYEAELGVVIGKRARKVSQAEAFEYVAGYVNANDVSARDLQFGDGQWVRGKSLDTFCPLGPWMVTKDEIADPHDLRIRSILNGTVMQDSNTSNLIFRIPELIEFITRAFTLLPGDIILTGTPPGVGVFREPKIFLQPGDEIAIEIEGLGRLTNPVVEDTN